MGYGLGQSNPPHYAGMDTTAAQERDLSRIKSRALSQASNINEICASLHMMADQIFGAEPAAAVPMKPHDGSLRPVGPLMPEIGEAQDAVDAAINSLRHALSRLNTL